MRGSSLKRLVAMAACGAATLGAGRASALDKYLDLEPAETKTGYGYGYNSIAREFVARQCVSFAPGLVDGTGGASGDDARFSVITTNDELADVMGLSVGAKFRASMGAVTLGAGGKVDFFQKTKTKLLSQTIVASWAGVEPFKYVAGDLTLKPEYLAMVGTPQFRQMCGDYVIVGTQSGRWLYGTVQLTSKSTVTQSQLAVQGSVDVDSGTYQASAAMDTVSKMKQLSGSKDLEIRMTTSGSTSMSLTIDEFLDQVRKFPGAKGAKQVYKLKAIPYESIVANWPPSNPLAPLTDEQKLNTLAEAAWALVALGDDADFVVQNASLFAMGTTPEKRAARLAWHKGRRTFYQNQLDGLRAAAKNCDVDWAGTPSCEAMYAKWKGWEDFAIGEYEQIPARYTSDCDTPRDIQADAASALGTALKSSTGSFQLTKGDAQVGGSPVRFAAWLDFKPNFTGGDPLAVRKLLGTLRVRIEEAAADHTTYEHTVKTDVLDLSVPAISNGGAVTYQQCAFHGTGVRVKPVTPPTSACDLIPSKPARDACVAAVAKDEHHGLISWTTAEDPTTETFTKGARGALQSLRCTVDDPHQSNDKAAIGCSAIGVASIQLDLTNRADVAADGWKAPPLEAIQLPKGVGNAALAAVLGKHVKAAAALRPARLVGGAPQAGATCTAPLVAVKGECVRALKR